MQHTVTRKKFTTGEVKGWTKDLDSCAHRGMIADQQAYQTEIQQLDRLTVDQYYQNSADKPYGR